MRLVEWTKPTVNGQANTSTVYNHPFAGLLGNVFGNEFSVREHASFVPAVNILEEENTYKLELAAPGYNKADFKISVEKRTLIVSAKHGEEKGTKEKRFSRKEFNYGSFQRAFRLPENANESAVVATYENGILVLEIPKREQDKNENREITVN